MLMRHPHTLANQEKTFPKENLSPYSIRGEKEYQESLNKDYPVKRILTSPYKRALTLAEGISEKKGIPMDVVDALKEVDMGLFGGLTFEEVKLKFPEETKVWLEDPESFTYPGGDSFKEKKEAVKKVLLSIHEDTLIVSHQAILYILSDLLGEAKSFETGEITIYEL